MVGSAKSLTNQLSSTSGLSVTDGRVGPWISGGGICGKLIG